MVRVALELEALYALLRLRALVSEEDAARLRREAQPHLRKCASRKPSAPSLRMPSSQLFSFHCAT